MTKKLESKVQPEEANAERPLPGSDPGATLAALEASERRYRARFDQAHMPQAITNLDGSITSVNDAMCGLLGREREELEGIPLRALSHSTDPGLADKRLAEVSSGRQEAGSWERVLAHKDGTPLPVLVHGALMRDANGAPL